MRVLSHLQNNLSDKDILYVLLPHKEGYYDSLKFAMCLLPV